MSKPDPQTTLKPYPMGRVRRFFHNVLGWAKPMYEAPMSYDGASLHSSCRYCLKEILQDSQGNWFHV